MKNKLRNYQIQTRLGSGSYGVIFKALNKTNKQQCVLKQIRMNKMSDKAKKSTLNEATIMGKLIHPFIVQYKESFVEEDTLHIVMEYCDNGDMSMYLKMQNKKPLKEEKIWKFFLQICLGLEYIHKNKILHRDIKSLNIFLNKNEDVKIGDLGVAKMLMANDFAQTIVGTPFYLSPELCEEKPYNEKSDIWALGCLLYELCTFKHPFEAANQASLILKIIRGKYSPIPQFYSKQLKDVIDMCLERDYKRRPTASMLLQRSKVRQYLNEFKLEDKIKAEYERMKAIKENKHGQSVQQNQHAQIVGNTAKSVEKKIGNEPSQEKNSVIAKKQTSSNKVTPSEIQNKKVSIDKKQQYQPDKKPSISGMPENNIFLPDKNNIIERLKPSNIALHKKELKPEIPLLKNQQSQKKIMQNKEEFLKNLQKAVDNNLQKQKSPLRQKPKAYDEAPISAVIQHQSRLQKIDMKIQQQLQRQKQIERQKALNERKKSETPSLVSPKIQEKQSIKGDHKSVPYLFPKESHRQMGKNQLKINDAPFMPPLPSKNKQQIIKVKMQQPPVQSKVLDIHKNPDKKSKGVIKSRGFTQEIQQQNNSQKIHARKMSDFKRNSVQNAAKPVLFGLDHEEKQRQQSSKALDKKPANQGLPRSSQYHSERNIKLISEQPCSNSRVQPKKQPQRQRYLFKKKPQAANISASRVRNKGASNSSQLSRNAKNASKFSEVTKEDEDDVMNLPDSLRHNNNDSSDEETQREREIRKSRDFMLKDINNDMVLKKYEKILSSKSIGNTVDLRSQNKQSPVNDVQLQNQKQSVAMSLKMKKSSEKEAEWSGRNFYPQQKVLDAEVDELLYPPQQSFKKPVQQLEFIPENESLAFKIHSDDQRDEILDESEQMIESEEKDIEEYDHQGIEEEIYEVNNFNLDDNEQNHQEYEDQRNLQDSFNPSRLSHNDNQQQTSSEWSFDQEPQLPMLQDKQSPFFQQANPYLMPQQQQQTIKEKRNYLQIRLQQNMKREDQINKLMQIKMDQCKAAVPKYFDEILDFFRKKINKEDQYTENDEKQVEDFLRRKGLTDQRKFQNIYKIMHFQMELQNTRKIIQRICKKLSELDNPTDND